jgi:hypothetical protein
MRWNDSPGERRASAETQTAGPDAADVASTADAAGTADTAATADGTGADGAEPDAARHEPACLPDDLIRRLAGLRASHPSSPGYAERRGSPADAWPPRAADPYRPWFSSGEPGEPWFTADPGDPPG